MTRALRILGAAFAALVFFAACGGDDGPSESDAIEVLTQQLVSAAGLAEADAQCVSEEIVGDIGVDGLAEIGVAAGESGDFNALSTDEQARLLELVQDAFGACDISAN